MKQTFLFLIALTSIILSTFISAQDATLCPEERLTMCTMDYTPVCALMKDNSVKTYGNACSACSDPQVVSHVKGICSAHTLLTEEVSTLFSGNTYQAIIPSRQLSMTVYVDPNGTMRGIQAGHKFTTKWQINDQGQICVSYKDKMNCRFVMHEDGKYKKYKLNEHGERVVLVIYQSFAKGNLYNY